MEYKINQIKEEKKLIREISVDFNGHSFYILYGKYVNGGFFSIPNWNTGGELSYDFNDVFWNAASIYRALKKKKAARAIAEAISKNEKYLTKKGNI